MHKTLIALAAALVCAAPIAQAAWQPLVQDGTRRVEVDPARGDTAGSHPSLWSRLTLSSPAVDPISGRPFATVEMLSRFDCENRRVATVERIYRDDNGHPLREEHLVSPRESAVEAGADERLFGLACKDALVGQAETGVKARAGHADFNQAVAGRIIAASDEHAAPKAEKPEKAAEKPGEKAGEKAPEKLPQPIRKPINPEQLPAQIKRQIVNPEQIAVPHKKVEKAEAPEHEAEAPPPRRKVHKARPAAHKVDKAEKADHSAEEHDAAHNPH